MDNIFMNSENSKIYDLHILLLNPNNNNNNNNIIVFSGGWGGVNLTLPSYFKKTLSNINITLYNC